MSIFENKHIHQETKVFPLTNNRWNTWFYSQENIQVEICQRPKFCHLVWNYLFEYLGSFVILIFTLPYKITVYEIPKNMVFLLSYA